MLKPLTFLPTLELPKMAGVNETTGKIGPLQIQNHQLQISPWYHTVMLSWGSDSFISPTYANDVSYLLKSLNFLFLHLSNRQTYLFPEKCLCMVTTLFASFNSQSFQASFGSLHFIETALAEVSIDLLATKSKSLLTFVHS